MREGGRVPTDDVTILPSQLSDDELRLLDGWWRAANYLLG